MKRYKIASVLIIIHSLIEILGCLALVPLFVMPEMQMDSYFSFIVPFFNENLVMMLIMGGIYGTIRLLGARALYKNKMWGLVLSVINCIVTLIVMMFMLPAGIMDGILSGAALILILSQYYEGKKAIE